ncbi:MAG: DNA gyrase subunit A [Promethearchaeota archaeon]|nr:MAG: DNA gyrase subunit A [Candidatus Lokiarchaeota archaeon]
MTTENIQEVLLKEEMKKSYIDYAMSVVIGRAIPDVRDGLKPVHRRILYAMANNNWNYNSSHVKCAKIVGETLGNFHPHGDAAVYNSLVRMAQDFSMRYPLIDPQGNFGSIDGDPPAAYRYTEARLAQISNELLNDIQKDTVEFQPNFDDSTVEPRYLPAALPNTLINGTKGIAVGMATSMAPHNLMEICQGIISTIDNPDISIEELMEVIKGPDFPTGGIIAGTTGIYNAYSTGHGNIKVKGRIEIEEKENRKDLIITEIPYLVNKTSLIESIAKLIREEVLKDVRDMRDESDRHGMRIVLELKKNAQPVIIQNILYKRTRLLTNFTIMNLVLINDGKQPKILTLKELIEAYIKHRLDIIYKRTDYDLKKAQNRLHKIEGLIIALNNIDKVIQIIKKSKDSKEAHVKLMDSFELSDIQTKAILNMPLSRLTNLEQQKLFDEEKELKDKIEGLNQILSSKEIRLSIIKEELVELSKKYGDERRTDIIEEKTDLDIKKKDLIKKEPTIVIMTQNHYIKRISLKEYRSQHRGGRGKRGAMVGDEDFVKDLFVCSTHDTILFFTSKGRAYSIKCFEIPLQTRNSKGKYINNLIQLKEEEEISEMIPINNFDTEERLIMVTKNGIVKKTPLKLFSKIYKTGKRAQVIRKGDALVSVKKLSNELQDIFIATKLGYAIRFDESELRELGRNTMGVKGVDLRKDDEINEAILVTDDTIVLTLTKNGYGQRTKIKEYRKTGRAAKGVININLSEQENDEVIAVRIAEEKDILIGTEQGQVIRMPVDSIRITHRRAKGVKLINLYEGDAVCAIGKCQKDLDSEDLDET